MSNPSTLLDKLSNLNDADTIDIYVPTAKKKMAFRGLTVKQQKEIIKTVADGPYSGITLNTAINNIASNNIVDDFELSIVDRYAIAVALREKLVDNKIELENGETVDLIEHIKECVKTIKSKPLKDSYKIAADSITVNIKVPTLKRDNSINEKIKKSNDNEISDTIGSLYVGEIVKFIDSIVLAGEEETVYKFEDIGYSTAEKIVESIPSSINQEIIAIISTVRDIENLFLKTSEGDIEITPAFFSGE